MDHFSRYVVLAPLPDKTAFSVARALVRYLFHPFTTPKVLLSDNGTEFRNSLVSDICAQYNITQTFVVAHHPASNGLVERANKKILEVLRHVVQGCHASWDEWIPQVASAINSSINSSIGESPYFVLFGEDKRLPYQLLLERPTPVYNIDDYAKVHLATSQRIFNHVRTSLDASRQLMVSRQHQHACPPTVAPGDLVFVAEPERSSKLSPRFSGPLRVLQTELGNKLRVRDLNTGVERVVHVDNCKVVHSDFPTPAEASLPGPTQVTTPPTQVPSSTTNDGPIQVTTPPTQVPSSNTNEYRSKLRSASRQV